LSNCGLGSGESQGRSLYPRQSAIRNPQSAILFDLDGTLIDSVELIVRSYQHATTIHLGEPLAREAIVPTIGLSLEAILEGLAPGRGPTLVETYREYMRANHDLLVRPYDGVLETLRALRERGYRLGIVTSKGRPAATLAFLQWALDAHVDATICAEDAPRTKPAPDPLLAAAAHLGVEPAQCCYIGDTPHDLIAAHAAGMGAIAVPWGAGTREALAAAQPDLWLEVMGDLLDHFPALPGVGATG
jgi:pyrophosphatase PpaX